MCRPDCPRCFFGLLFPGSEPLCPSLPPEPSALCQFSKTGEEKGFVNVNVTQSIHVKNIWYLAWNVVNLEPPACRLVHHHASFLVANAAQAFINSRRRSNRSVLK